MCICVCCAVEEIMTALEGNIQQMTDQRLAEQREIELLNDGAWVDHYHTLIINSLDYISTILSQYSHHCKALK